MANSMRFGRRLPIPSTRQIRHELIVLGLQDEARQQEADRKPAPTDPLAAASATDGPIVDGTPHTV